MKIINLLWRALIGRVCEGGSRNRRAPDELGSSAAAEVPRVVHYVITKTHGYYGGRLKRVTSLCVWCVRVGGWWCRQLISV